MSIKLQLPELTDLRPRLVVIGVGGAGCNAINNMIAAGLTGVEFVVANTDAQALAASSAEHRLQLGAELTEGLGAGSKPEIGKAAAEEAIEEIRAQVSGAHMVFIAAGMGGGTGTGAAATIASVAREMGILTVGVVTKPFQFEGARRMRIAEAGIAELKCNVDTLIVIPNQNLFRLANEKTTFSEAFVLADQVLYSGVACIVDLIIKEGLINLDFADVRTVISGMGSAMMGTGEAEGERRAIVAAEEAIANPLLDDVSLEGARGLLLSITGGADLTLYEVDEAASRVREEVDPEANIIVGATYDDSLGDRVRVSIVASGMQKTLGVESSSDWKAPPPLASTGSPATPAVFSPQVGSETSAAPAPTETQAQGAQTVQQRLTEALQSEPADIVEPPHPPMADSAPPIPITHYGGEAEFESVHSTSATEDGGAAWNSAGTVTIEDGLPPLPNDQPAATQYDAPAASQYANPQDFQPAMVEEVPRSGRRMPSVEDFPPHAQMEFHQKHAHASTSERAGFSDPFAQEPPRKRTLMDRLTGRARRKGDSFVDNANSESELQSVSETYPNDSSEQRVEQTYIESDGAPQGRHQDADLPMFFGRIAK